MDAAVKEYKKCKTLKYQDIRGIELIYSPHTQFPPLFGAKCNVEVFGITTLTALVVRYT